MSALDDLPPPSAGASALDNLPPPTHYDPSEGGSTLQFGPFDTGIPIGQTTTRVLAGAGKAATDLARGAGQWLGLESREDVAESRKRDAPLMATTAGKVGDIAGSAAFAAPAMLIPGAQGPAGAAAVGAATGALQPSTSTEETAENIGLGGTFGAAGSWLGGLIAKGSAAWNAARQAAASTQAGLAAERDAVLAAGRQAGYVVPPTAVNPNAMNTALESISGKAATRQAAAEANQKVTNGLVRQDLGLPSDAPITPQTLQGVRAQAGQVYNAVKSAGRVVSDPQYHQDLQAALTGSPQLQSAYAGIGGQADPKLQELVQAVSTPEHDASNMVEAVKYIRNQAKGNFKSSFASGNPDALALARGQQDVADSMEDLLKRHLQANGQGDLADAWDAARTTIAKTYSTEAALNGNNVSAANLAAQAKRGKPMSDGMDLAAKFGTHFPDVAGVPGSGVGVSKLGAAVAGAGQLGAAYLHSPTMAAGAATMAAAPYVARGAMLSRPGQALLATPSYGPGVAGTAALGTLGAIGRRGGMAGAVPLSQLMGTQSQ
ncbi:MAG TPA: hypothetical protein VNX47_15150 [Nevskia sp.]|nr:hypothetical protein [Nevskia sp.]